MTQTSPSPIGTLILDAESKGQKKSGGHTAHAKGCTCEVEVGWFSETSRRVRISPCAEHVVRKPQSEPSTKTSKRGRR